MQSTTTALSLAPAQETRQPIYSMTDYGHAVTTQRDQLSGAPRIASRLISQTPPTTPHRLSGGMRSQRACGIGQAVLIGQARQGDVVLNADLFEQARLVGIDGLGAEIQALGDVFLS